MAPEIRTAREDEIDAVSELIVRSYSTLREGFPWPEEWPAYLANVADVRARWGTSRLWVAERDGRLAGTADYYPPGTADYYPGAAPDPTCAALRGLAVDPGERGTGLGRVLTEHVIGLARGDQATHVILHSIPHMAAAVHIYEAMGFERLPAADFPPAPGSEGQVLAFWLAL